MTKIVETVFGGQPSHAERELGGNRPTLRQGVSALDGKFCELERYPARGGQKSEAHLPNWLTALRAIGESQSQPAAPLRTNRWYTRLSAAEGRHPLLQQKGDREDDLPCAATMGTTLKQRGDHWRAVQQSRPQKNA
jgi:hypothetical protein